MRPLNVRKHPSAPRSLGNHRQLVTLANNLNQIDRDDAKIVGELVTPQRLLNEAMRHARRGKQVVLLVCPGERMEIDKATAGED